MIAARLATGFATFPLSHAVQGAITTLGLTEPTPIQIGAIPPLLKGQDVIGQARTGSGKTLAFAVPLVEKCDPAVRTVQALVLAPTRELAIQIGAMLQPLADARRLQVALLYGGRSMSAQQHALRTAQIVIGTPGRTLDHLRQGTFRPSGLKHLVLDEADELLDRGFAPDVERILGALPVARQSALFSATMPAWVATIAAKHLRNPVVVRVDSEERPPSSIEHLVYDVHAEEKLDVLRTLLDRRGRGSVIVFGRTKHGVKKLAQRLVGMGYPTAALQGNLSQNARERVLSDFRAGRVPILLATNVAARGLDVENVEHVINYEVPESASWFTHRVGRTGRMGRQGAAITLVSPDEAPKWREIEKVLGHRLPRQAWDQKLRSSTPATVPSTAAATTGPKGPRYEPQGSADRNRPLERVRPLPPRGTWRLARPATAAR